MLFLLDCVDLGIVGYAVLRGIEYNRTSLYPNLDVESKGTHGKQIPTHVTPRAMLQTLRTYNILPTTVIYSSLPLYEYKFLIFI